MTGALVQAQHALSTYDRAPDLQWLRRARQELGRVDLLAPAQPDERLALRAQVLAGWLAVVVRLDHLLAGLEHPAPGDARGPAERNRLTWQCDAFDQELSSCVLQFVAQYYTPAPVDLRELDAAMDASGLSPRRRGQWQVL